MLFSVIMANYNRGKFVDEAIQSALRQTVREFELVIVENGSTDGSLEIIEKWARMDRRIVHVTEPRRGAAFAFNRGIEESKGDLITILDSDDVCHPERLARYSDFFQAHKAIDICHTNGWILDEAGKATGQIYDRDIMTLPRDLEQTGYFRALLWKDFIIGGSVMARRECFEEEKFDTSLNTAMDWDLWVRLARKFQFGYIAEPLYGYRLHPGNTWAPANNRKAMQYLPVVYKKWLKFPDLTEEDRNVVSYHLLKQYRELGDWSGIFHQMLTNRNARRILLDSARRTIPGSGGKTQTQS